MPIYTNDVKANIYDGLIEAMKEHGWKEREDGWITHPALEEVTGIDLSIPGWEMAIGDCIESASKRLQERQAQRKA